MPFKRFLVACTVAQSLTPVDLKWSPPTSVVSWPWWCIAYISRKNEICFGALFKISKKIVLYYNIFFHKSLWWIFLIILTAYLISDDIFRFVWYVTLYTFAKEIKAYFFVTLLNETMLNSKILLFISSAKVYSVTYQTNRKLSSEMTSAVRIIEKIHHKKLW